MLALLVPVGVMLLVAFLVHKQKVRNGENGLPYLGLLFDTIAPYDPSTPYCTPPSSPTSLELSNMRTVEPSKSPSATLQLLPPAVQFELPTSPSVDDQPAAFAADVTLAPAALPPIFPTHPVNHTRKEKFDIGGLQSTAPGPELLSTTDLIRLGDSVKAAESFGDFQTKIGDSEEPRAPLVPALASLEQKASSKHHHHRQEGEAALRSEDGDLSQQPNVGVEQSLGLVESSSDLKIETEEARLQMKSTPTPDTANHKAENTFASKTTIKESTEETAVGTTNERQLSGHHSFRSSSDYLHYRKSKASNETDPQIVVELYML
uniref:Uncharacterized protein n=1 Tax=Plectus sambesii TaxID=2011161 RepID=A0A914WYX5_9BILA